MLIFEAWDIVSTIIVCSIEDLDESNTFADKFREAFKISDGLMQMFLMKLDDMEDDKITITRDEISEVLGDGK